MSVDSLQASVPANNEKIIELYNKVRSGQLITNPDFQRKLVWKKQHKINFIDTILHNFPFPEIYKAPGELDVDSLALTDVIVDGQQRVTTIVSFIEGKDIFALKNIKPKFEDLDKEEKTKFLNYEISVRYLKNASKEQVIEIFQRINNTEYRLNNTERTNAQWGDSEYIHFVKQILEKDYSFDPAMFSFIMDQDIRIILNDFFSDNDIFTNNDNSRMLSLQWMLALVTTILEGSYFGRFTKVQNYIEQFNEEFEDAVQISEQLKNVVLFINACKLDEDSYLFNKTNMFSLITELYKYDLQNIKIDTFISHLNYLDETYKKYALKETDPEEIDSEYIQYFEHVRDSGNELKARRYRGEFIEKFIKESLHENSQ